MTTRICVPGLPSTVPSELLQGIAELMPFVPLTMIVLSKIPRENPASAFLSLSLLQKPHRQPA